MINKLLCFMWGHVYTKWVSVDINYGWLGEYETARRIYYKCKHCGKVKNDS